jgi:hypothetical protein
VPNCLTDIYKGRTGAAQILQIHNIIFLPITPSSPQLLNLQTKAKMKFLALAAALAIPALAMPEPVSGGSSLDARDNVKLNQYRSMDDW